MLSNSVGFLRKYIPVVLLVCRREQRLLDLSQPFGNPKSIGENVRKKSGHYRIF